MFLNQLEEESKELFLKLCVHASLSNGVISDHEKEMISAYCREMNISERIPACNESLDVTLSTLSTNASDVEKNIIILELLGLVKSDGAYDSEERKFMEQLTTDINAKQSILSKLDSLLEIYSAVYKELLETICE